MRDVVRLFETAPKDGMERDDLWRGGHAPRIARPVCGSKKCRARWSTLHLDRLALPHPRARAEAPDQARLVRLNPGRELSDRTVVADVLGELTHVLGNGLGRRDLEVHEHLRAERLRHLDPPVEPGPPVSIGERRVFEILRPDSEDDLPSLVCGERWTARERFTVQREPHLTDDGSEAVAPPARSEPRPCSWPGCR